MHFVERPLVQARAIDVQASFVRVKGHAERPSFPILMLDRVKTIFQLSKTT